MLIKSDKKYITSLIKLWNTVFGDSEEYIKLFFKEAYYDGECFGEIADGKVISAFYLLKCSVRYAGKTYEGRYLYAAATLPEYRGKGLMARLIGEAITYCKAAGLDFIALVPASDSLYDYYGRYGFVDAMHKYKFSINNEFVTLRAYREIEDAFEFYKIRSSAEGVLFYDETASDYAYDCLNFSGNIITYIGEDSFYIDGEELFVGKNFDAAVNFLSSLPGEKTIYSDKPLRNAEKLRNGMIYYFCDDLKNTDIYMNIALD